jgi:hypothetical protein
MADAPDSKSGYDGTQIDGVEGFLVADHLGVTSRRAVT